MTFFKSNSYYEIIFSNINLRKILKQKKKVNKEHLRNAPRQIIICSLNKEFFHCETSGQVNFF